ncbi:MAG TPA: HD domain-containing protein [Lachnospiraceae bacterium]|nr:HD domain-containing protein [Lachnospiraceae bacterium]
MQLSAKVADAMITYFEGDIKRIDHFLKVYAFAKTIGELEEIDGQTQTILEIAALTHDIGIKNSEKKYNSSAGHYQELEGPGEAWTLLWELQVDENIIERVCWLIAHHHTYEGIDDIDYQILVEADFLVNAAEEHMKKNALESVKTKIFRTEAGKKLFDDIYFRGF